MISSQHEKILGVLDFVREEEANALQTLRSAVYIVAEEQIVGVWREAAVLKQPQQVRVSTGIHPSIHNKQNTIHVKISNIWSGKAILLGVNRSASPASVELLRAAASQRWRMRQTSMLFQTPR